MELKYAQRGHLPFGCWNCSHSTDFFFFKEHSYFQETEGFPKDQGQSAWAWFTLHLFQKSSISPMCVHNVTGSLGLRTYDSAVWQNQQIYTIVLMGQLHEFPRYHGQSMEIKWQKALFFFITSLMVESHNITKQTNWSRRSQVQNR